MLDRSEFRELSKDIKKALLPVAEKYSITIDPGNISYTDLDATMKLKLTDNTHGREDYEKKKFNQLCQAYGFEPEDYLRNISLGGEPVKLVGFNPKAKKYPVILQAMDGKKYKVHVGLVQSCLNKDLSIANLMDT